MLVKTSRTRIEKSSFSRLRNSKVTLTLLQQATKNSKEGRTKLRRKDQEIKTKKEQNKK
jgi:hypothetical protein